MDNSVSLSRYEKYKVANCLSSKKYYEQNKEKVKDRIKARYAEKKDEKTLCKICGRKICSLTYNSHLKSKKHLKNISNNSILQFMLFEKS